MKQRCHPRKSRIGRNDDGGRASHPVKLGDRVEGLLIRGAIVGGVADGAVCNLEKRESVMQGLLVRKVITKQE